MHFMYSKPNSWPAPSSLRKNGTLFFLRLSQPSKRHVLPVSQTKNLHAILDSPLLLKPHIQVLSKCCWLYLQTYGGRARSLFFTTPPPPAQHRHRNHLAPGLLLSPPTGLSRCSPQFSLNPSASPAPSAPVSLLHWGPLKMNLKVILHY